MGRSQLKYRSRRGGGRNVGSDGRWGRGGRSSGGNTRELDLNTFRYREYTGEHAEEEHDTVSSEENHAQRQFFASEQAYRDKKTTSESYFQTKSVKEWEDDEPDIPQYGVLDFNWIAAQLANIPPSQRYYIDPKYCEEFDFDMEKYNEKQRQRQEEKEKKESEQSRDQSQDNLKISESPIDENLEELLALTLSHGQSQDNLKTIESPVDENLEELLALTPSDGIRPKNFSPKVVKKSPFNSEKKNVSKDEITVPTAIDQQQQQPTMEEEQQPLEKWLDDVLDI